MESELHSFTEINHPVNDPAPNFTAAHSFSTTMISIFFVLRSALLFLASNNWDYKTTQREAGALQMTSDQNSTILTQLTDVKLGGTKFSGTNTTN